VLIWVYAWMDTQSRHWSATGERIPAFFSRCGTAQCMPPGDRPNRQHGAMALAAAMAAVEELGMSDAGAEFDEVGARWSDQVLRCAHRALRHTNTHFSATTALSRVQLNCECECIP